MYVGEGKKEVRWNWRHWRACESWRRVLRTVHDMGAWVRHNQFLSWWSHLKKYQTEQLDHKYYFIQFRTFSAIINHTCWYFKHNSSLRNVTIIVYEQGKYFCRPGSFFCVIKVCFIELERKLKTKLKQYVEAITYKKIEK